MLLLAHLVLLHHILRVGAQVHCADSDCIAPSAVENSAHCCCTRSPSFCIQLYVVIDDVDVDIVLQLVAAVDVDVEVRHSSAHSHLVESTLELGSLNEAGPVVL